MLTRFAKHDAIVSCNGWPAGPIWSQMSVCLDNESAEHLLPIAPESHV